MDPLPGTYYWKGLILVRAPDAPSNRLRLEPKEKPEPLRAPIEPLKHADPLAPLPSPRLVSIA
jgi:hypothetical protein